MTVAVKYLIKDDPVTVAVLNPISLTASGIVLCTGPGTGGVLFKAE